MNARIIFKKFLSAGLFTAIFLGGLAASPAFAARESGSDDGNKYRHGYYSKKRGKSHGGSDENSRRNKKLAKIRQEQAEAADTARAEGVETDEN